MKWPTKEDRELFEIEEFIRAYGRFPDGRQFSIIRGGERPDWIVADVASSEEFGVELTSVYLDNRSVPDQHVNSDENRGLVEIPYCKETLYKYMARIISGIKNKILKARHGYDTARPLILSVYLNEYIGIYLQKEDMGQLVMGEEVLFGDMTPFSEIVFWPLGNGNIFRVRQN